MYNIIFLKILSCIIQTFQPLRNYVQPLQIFGENTKIHKKGSKYEIFQVNNTNILVMFSAIFGKKMKNWLACLYNPKNTQMYILKLKTEITLPLWHIGCLIALTV